MVFAVQGWSSIIPTFSPADFISLYIEIPIIIVMFFAWLFFSRRESELSARSLFPDPSDGNSPSRPNRNEVKYHDLVDINTVDLIRDEYDEEDDTGVEDEMTSRLNGKMKLLWTFYYWLI